MHTNRLFLSLFLSSTLTAVRKRIVFSIRSVRRCYDWCCCWCCSVPYSYNSDRSKRLIPFFLSFSFNYMFQHIQFLAQHSPVYNCTYASAVALLPHFNLHVSNYKNSLLAEKFGRFVLQYEWFAATCSHSLICIRRSCRFDSEENCST